MNQKTTFTKGGIIMNVAFFIGFRNVFVCQLVCQWLIHRLTRKVTH